MIQLFGQSVAPLRAAEDAMALPPVGMRVLPASARGERRFFNLGVRRSLELHWRLPLAAAIAFTALAISYFLTEALVLKAWPAYTAESIVNLKPAAAKVLPDSGGQPRSSFDGDTYETYIQQKMMSVSRQDVLVSALHKLAGFQSAGESDQAAAQRLVRELEVTRLGPAYQFSIRARAGSPAMAAQIANTVTAAGIESAMRDDRTRNAQQMQMWTEERDRIQSALAADQAELDALNKQPRVTEAGVAMDRLQRLSELEAEIPLLRGRWRVVGRAVARPDPGGSRACGDVPGDAGGGSDWALQIRRVTQCRVDWGCGIVFRCSGRAGIRDESRGSEKDRRSAHDLG